MHSHAVGEPTQDSSGHCVRGRGLCVQAFSALGPGTVIAARNGGSPSLKDLKCPLKAAQRGDGP